MKFASIILLLIPTLLLFCNYKNDNSKEQHSKELKNISAPQKNSPHNTLKIYISADRTGTKESAIAIEQGIKTALSETNDTICGRKIETIVLNHRGNTPRSNKHLKQYLNDPNALVFYSGLHSPPIISAMDYINKNKILLFLPWAAAGSLTRCYKHENWIFRLSLDDTKAARIITYYTIEKERFKRPFLLLESTGWGKSNEISFINEIKKYNIEIVGIQWFNWKIGSVSAKQMLHNIYLNNADVIFFVGNTPEGKIFAKQMSELNEKERLPIRSHWGITGGNFPQIINAEIRKKIDLKFIQSKFSFFKLNR